ncbi:hypothetical protein OsI_02400 [Oryza sativa Indica Group]|uniref:Uncharacterized protein n=1 Tax=Oryza sativa subsp. indica TaxID=39946 RepID=B8AA25_ORYSI|nr:hypothetical protein OsI_02400 [Oryza sativa Indica Group]
MAPSSRKERAAEARASTSKPSPAPAPAPAVQVQRRPAGGGRWTSRRISFYASRAFFLLIILQIPLFRFPRVPPPAESSSSSSRRWRLRNLVGVGVGGWSTTAVVQQKQASSRAS